LVAISLQTIVSVTTHTEREREREVSVDCPLALDHDGWWGLTSIEDVNVVKEVDRTVAPEEEQLGAEGQEMRSGPSLGHLAPRVQRGPLHDLCEGKRKRKVVSTFA
jgi:hypothetical protein